MQKQHIHSSLTNTKVCHSLAVKDTLEITIDTTTIDSTIIPFDDHLIEFVVGVGPSKRCFNRVAIFRPETCSGLTQFMITKQ